MSFHLRSPFPRGGGDNPHGGPPSSRGGGGGGGHNNEGQSSSSFFQLTPPNKSSRSPRQFRFATQPKAHHIGNSTSGSTTPTTLDHVPVRELRLLLSNNDNNNFMIGSSSSMTVFYASILYSKTQTMNDALILAQAHFQRENYTACLQIIQDAGLLAGLPGASNTNSTSAPASNTPYYLFWKGLLLAGQALGAIHEWNTVLELMEEYLQMEPHSSFPRTIEDHDMYGWKTLKESMMMTASEESPGIHVLALILKLRANACFETSNIPRATHFWKLALQIDPRCQDAFQTLLDRSLLSPLELYELVSHQLEFPESMKWLADMYLAQIPISSNITVSPTQPETSLHLTLDASSIHIASSPDEGMADGMVDAGRTVHFTPAVPREIGPSSSSANADAKRAQQLVEHSDGAFQRLWHDYKLNQAPQVLALAAKRAYCQYDWEMVIKHCEALQETDPSLPECAYAYISTLVVLGHKNVLFRIAHEWVEASPHSAKAWFAVGAYYYCCERYHVAQRHFCRATRVDPQSTEAWIAFGCSFAACDESDQALASFRAAQRLSPGDHSSLLYMGMEYVRTNHLVLASYFLQAALSVSSGDALCMNELGVLSAQKGDHEAAVDWFLKALASSQGGSSLEENLDFCLDSYWEPTIFNLGHSLRKLRRFQKAASCFGRCVALCPKRHSTYSALGYTYHLMGNIDAAIQNYHKALAHKRDDPFSTEMLDRALKDSLEAFDLFGSKSKAVASVVGSGQPPMSKSFLFGSPQPGLSKPDFSVMSEGIESDVDMSDL